MRCFVAAWPDEPTRLALASLSDDVRQRIEHRRITRADDLHLTLAFIGDLVDDVAFDLADAVATLRFKAFAWQLDALGFFKEAGVVWVGATNATVRPLADLADRVRALLNQMNVAYDCKPLVPHVTLLRGVKKFAAEKVAPILWRVESIALYRSAPARQASRYVRVAP
jgi:RNA 2',3'-cyclic 3'-phosphodiesterase